MPTIIQITTRSGLNLEKTDKQIDSSFPFGSNDLYLGVISTQGIYGVCTVKLGEDTPSPEQVQWLEAAKQNNLIIGYAIQQVTDNDLAQLLHRKEGLA